MPVAEWMQKEAQGLLPPGDYEVTAIVDERRRGRGSAFIVKWKASTCSFLSCHPDISHSIDTHTSRVFPVPPSSLLALAAGCRTDQLES